MTTTHLTVISYTQVMSNLFEPIALRTYTFNEHRVLRCQKVAELRELVVKAGRGKVTLLDLVGHGGTSRFGLGDEMFVEGPGRLPKVLQDLDRDLHPKAVVRLVGCLTGVGAEGQAMIQSISKALSGRLVFGMTDRVQPQDFDESGLKETYHQMASSKNAEVVPPELKVPPGSVSGSGVDDVSEGRKWAQHFPPGYKSLGRGEPLALIDYSTYFGKVKITFACDRRLVMIEDKPPFPPLLLGWNSAAPVPIFHPQLLDASAGEGDAHLDAAPALVFSTQRRPIAKSKRRGGR